MKPITRSGLSVLLSSIPLLLFVAGTLVLPIFFLPYTRDAVNLPKIFFLYYLITIGTLVFMAQLLFKREGVIRKSFLDVPLILLLITVIVSTAFSVSVRYSLFGTMDRFLLTLPVMVLSVGWYWLCIQCESGRRHFFVCIDLLLLGGCLAGIFFWVQGFDRLLSLGALQVNVVSNLYSVFGVYMAIVGIVGIGFLFAKERQIHQQILPVLAATVSSIVLFQLGFTASLVLFAIGIGCVFVLAGSMMRDVRQWVFVFVFPIFISCILGSLFGVPQFIKRTLPLEVALGVVPSSEIAGQTILDNAKSFLIGSGPATFEYDFSRFKSPAFGNNAFAFLPPFFTPFSTVFALAIETGIVGLIFVVIIVLLVISAAIRAWTKNRPTVWQASIAGTAHAGLMREEGVFGRKFEVFVLGIAWLVATIGMFFTFYDVTSWWLWWWLLATFVVGLSSFVPGLVEEKKMTVRIAPQYAVLFSTALVIGITVLVIAGVYAGRIFFAEVLYTRAIVLSEASGKKEALLQRTLAYHPHFVPYLLTLGKTYLDQAQEELVRPEPKSETVTNALVEGVKVVKEATLRDSQNATAWKLLADLYITARPFAAESNQWAGDALQEAIKQAPVDPELWVRLGNVQVFAGAYDDAIQSFTRAGELRPGFVDAYVGLSHTYEEQGNMDAAIAAYQPILKEVDTVPALLFELGRLFYNRAGEGDIDRAELVWQRAVTLEPTFANALYGLGLLYEKKGNLMKAREYFTSVAKLNPDHPEVKKKLR